LPEEHVRKAVRGIAMAEKIKTCALYTYTYPYNIRACGVSVWRSIVLFSVFGLH